MTKRLKTPRQRLITILAEHNVQIAPLKILRKKGKETMFYCKGSGSQALTTWEQLRNLVERTLYWPVLLGTALDLKYLSQAFRSHEEPKPVYGEGFVMRSSLSTKHMVNQSGAVGRGWLERERQQRSEQEELFPRGEWPVDGTPDNRISSIYDYRTSEPYPEVYMALVPDKRGWLVPAFLSFGDWNDCPPPEVHVSIFKYWHDTYGAEVVALSHDTVELRVHTAPASREAALQLAEDQFLYCSDMAAGGTVDDLAAQLLTASIWSFWWD